MEASKQEVERTLLRHNLALTVEQLRLNLMELQLLAEELPRGGR